MGTMKHFPELQLTSIGARVLGCLLEKEILTPDLYPLTLNSLVTACNQSTSRHPVTTSSASEIEEALRQLSEDYLVTKIMGGRSPKFEHDLPDILALTNAERAILTVLLSIFAQGATAASLSRAYARAEHCPSEHLPVTSHRLRAKPSH